MAHGATGKGNDQVRFELGYYALEPDIKVIAPWREWDLTSRAALIEFAEKHQIPIAKDKRGEAPFSTDANLCTSRPRARCWRTPARKCRTMSIRAPSIRRTRPTSRNTSRSISSAAMRSRSTARSCRRRRCSTKLNELGRKHGIGRLDLVENRFVGMKSRGMYETPGGTILLAAHRGIEQITLDRGAAHLKDELMPSYAELIYNGFWFSPEREMLQAAIDKSQEFVTGRVRLKLYKGSAAVVGRESPYSLYDQDLVTFEEGAVAYDQRDAAGFIKLNALRLRTLASARKSTAPACRSAAFDSRAPSLTPARVPPAGASAASAPRRSAPCRRPAPSPTPKLPCQVIGAEPAVQDQPAAEGAEEAAELAAGGRRAPGPWPASAAQHLRPRHARHQQVPRRARGSR